MGNKTNEKKMTIYYAGSSQVINYFKTTKKRDLLSMAFKLFSLTQKHSFEEL